ncbi:LacI family DNA-binding transcriptional regulator [Butyricicoccus sp.]|uniref:LacI family DNA-binding transcriptional regulator n=1 Tax=Butyricicoccus sp. TaxID=2049021 RepID=UPI003F15545B
MKMTIEKIAEMAGVSRGTVDKVIHGRPGVRDSVREQVLQIIRQSGYVPPRAKLEPDCKKVAVMMPHLKNPYFAALKRELDALVRTRIDFELEYHFCETTDITSQLAALDASPDADAWLIRGVRSRRLQARLETIRKPIFFLDAEVPGISAVCKIGEDCRKSGRIAASLTAKSMNYTGQVVVIAGGSEIVSHRQRLEGFLEAMRSRYPQVQVVKQLFSQDQSVVAYEQACRILDEFPHLNAICNLAGYAGEIGQAILERQRAVRMVCYDINQDVASLIQKGIVEFSIGLEPVQQARILVDTIYSYLLLGIAPAADFIETPISIAFDEAMHAMPVASRKTHEKTHENDL